MSRNTHFYTYTKLSADLRPTDHEYALLSQHVYRKGSAKPVADTNFITMYRGWKVLYTRKCDSGYFGAVYMCENSKQYVIASRGTSGISDLIEDYRGVLLNKYSAQKEDAFLLVDLIVHQIRVQRPNYKVSFTGHSLGAFLAELCVYYCVHTLEFPNVNAVTFESPGSKQSMKTLMIEHDVVHLGKKAPIPQDKFLKLDIVTYLCYPNAVNACNEHVGSVYSINVDLKLGSLASLPIIRLLSSHKMEGIVGWFNEAYVNCNANYTRNYMARWPCGYKQLKIYFKHAMLKNRMYSLDPALTKKEIPPPPIPSNEYALCGKEDTSLSSVSIASSNSSVRPHDHSRCLEHDKWFEDQKSKIQLQYYGNFKVLQTQTSFHILPLHHFSPSFQKFLKYFLEKLIDACGSSPSTTEKVKAHLQATWKAFDMPDDVSESVLSYIIKVNPIGLEEVICGRPAQSAHNFRQIVSSWLDKTGFTVDDLINDEALKEFAVKANKSHYGLPPPIPTYDELENQRKLKPKKSFPRKPLKPSDSDRRETFY